MKIQKKKLKLWRKRIVEEYRKLVYEEEKNESAPTIYKILLTAAGFVATEIAILIIGVSLGSMAKI